MAQSSTKYLNIEALTGENYHNWKFRIKMILLEHGVSKYVEKEWDTSGMSEESKENFSKGDNKAKSLIVQAVSDSQLEYLRDKTTAFRMWKTLEDRYEKKGLPGQLSLKRRLLSMKMKEGESLETHIQEFEEIVRQLKAAGVKTDEKDIICNLLMTLPKTFETVVTVIENIQPDLLEYDIVKSKLLAEEEKRKIEGKRQSGGSNIPTAFLTEKVCYGCGKRGHIRRDCWFERKGEQSTSEFRGHGRENVADRGNFRGQNRGFFRGQNRGTSRSQNRGNYRGQGSSFRSRGRGFQHNTNFVQSDEQHENENQNLNENNVCFNVETNNLETKSSNVSNLTFCIDSGCTDHLVNDKTMFSQLVTLEH